MIIETLSVVRLGIGFWFEKFSFDQLFNSRVATTAHNGGTRMCSIGQIYLIVWFELNSVSYAAVLVSETPK